MKVTHSWTDKTATIRVEGLNKAVRMLHITDSHVALIDDRNADYLEACKASGDRFESRDSIFREMMTESKKLELDLVALTGDIVHFPSCASIESAAKSISIAEAPVLYTAGNHDWHFPGLKGREELRDAWWPALKPLYHTNASFERHEIGGLQFLLVDNSTYQIAEDQLSFIKDHLAEGLPSVILTHIPLSLPTLRDHAIEKWKAPILVGDPDWELESRNRWGTGEDLPSTLEFVRCLRSEINLVALFCGHVHFPHVDAINLNAVQYVGPPGYAAESRLVEFQPL